VNVIVTPEDETMAQASDSNSTINDDNVRPFPGAGPDPQPRHRTRAKDRRAAARQAKFRSKTKADRDAKPDKDVPPPPADDASERSSRRVRLATLTAALGLATVSGGFSITGMTSIFVGGIRRARKLSGDKLPSAASTKRPDQKAIRVCL
jgi:hypothetical protein